MRLIKMKLLFIALTENRSIRGVERYSLELLKALSNNDNVRITVLHGEWQNYFDILQAPNITLKKIRIPNNKLCRHLYLIFFAPRISKPFHLVHYANTLPVLFKNGPKTVLTVHDLAEYFVPEKYSKLQTLYRKQMLRMSLRNIDHFLTVSFSTKNSIHDVLRISHDRITCIYPGINHFQKSPTTTIGNEDIKLLSDPYFLYFGAIERTKGIEELVNAFERFSVGHRDYKLYLIGKKANAHDFLQKKVNDKILYLGYKSDELVNQYLRNAKAVFNLSKFEGFGFPVLEAFLFNDNIVSSSTTSLGEISKDFAWLVNPVDVAEISARMEQVVLQPKSFDLLAKEKILSKYDWATTAQQYVSLIRGILGQ
jgi:glycosyltransferase involved in cell wall biosynthesis